MNYVDLFLGLVLLRGIYKGFRRGLVLTLGGVFGWVISLAVAALYSGNFKQFLDKNFSVTSKTGEWLTKNLPLSDAVQSVGLNGNTLEVVVENLALPNFMRESLLDEIIKNPSLTVDSATYALGYGLGSLIMKGISFVIVFLIVSFFLRLFLSFLNKGLNMTFLGGVNRLGGGVAGLFINGGILAILIGSIYPFLALVNSSNPVIMQIKSSFIIPPLVKIFDFLSNKFIF